MLPVFRDNAHTQTTVAECHLDGFQPVRRRPLNKEPLSASHSATSPISAEGCPVVWGGGLAGDIRRDFRWSLPMPRCVQCLNGVYGVSWASASVRWLKIISSGKLP